MPRQRTAERSEHAFKSTVDDSEPYNKMSRNAPYSHYQKKIATVTVGVMTLTAVTRSESMPIVGSDGRVE